MVTGCYAQRAPEEIAALPGVDLVIGNSHKHQLAEIALPELFRADETPRRFCPALISAPRAGELRTENSIFVSDIFAHTELLAAPVFDTAGDSHESLRTRPNLKVQDGCDNRCSFCVIPYVRGQSRSLAIDRILREVNGLVDSGYREVVISGINLGRWGRDLAVSGQLSAVSKSRQRADGRRPRRRSSAGHPRRNCFGETAHLFGRAHGLDRRTDRSGRILAAHRQARACPHAVRQRRRVAAHASQISSLALSREDREDSRRHAERGHRRRRDGRIPRRDRCRI